MMDELAVLEGTMRKQHLRIWPRTMDSELLALPLAAYLAERRR